MNLTLTLSAKLPAHMAGVMSEQRTFKGSLSMIMAEAFDALDAAKRSGVFDAGGCVDMVVQLDRPEEFSPRNG